MTTAAEVGLVGVDLGVVVGVAVGVLVGVSVGVSVGVLVGVVVGVSVGVDVAPVRVERSNGSLLTNWSSTGSCLAGSSAAPACVCAVVAVLVSPTEACPAEPLSAARPV